jgi:hypothetical protein
MCFARFLVTCLFAQVFTVPAAAQGLLGNIPQAHTNLVYPSLLVNPRNEIRSMDVYVDNQGNIQLLMALSRNNNSQLEVYYTRSENGGQSWITPMVISTDQGPPTESKRGNDLQVAARDQALVVVWQVRGEFPGNGILVSAWSSDNGAHWQAGGDPSDDKSKSDHGYMDLLADGQGNFHLVWFDDREESGNYNGLRYTISSDGGREWRRNVTLDDKTCTCCWGKITRSSAQALNVLYRDAEPWDMAMMRSEDGGGHWTRVGPVGEFHWEFNGCPHTGGGLAEAIVHGQEILHGVVWTGSEATRGLYYLRSTNHGTSWMSLSRLGDDRAQHADVAAYENQVVAVWDAAGSDGSVILMSRSSNGGQAWSDVRQLTDAAASGSHPRVVATPLGFLILWTERNDNAPQRLAMAILDKRMEPLDNNINLLNNNQKIQR